MRLAPLLLALSVSPSSAQAANCALANLLDYGSYFNLTLTDESDAGMDENAYDWADCRVARLNSELAKQPQVRARMGVLRQQFREMRSLEGGFAYVRNGGGTLYTHAIPRMFPYLEEQIASLAGLATSKQGAQTGARFAGVIAQARAEHLLYIKTLRAYKPGPGEDYSTYEPKRWARDVDSYEQLGRAIMLTLGDRNDAATAMGYSILNTVTFSASEDDLN